MSEENEMLYSTNETDKGLLEILEIQKQLVDSKPDRLGLIKSSIVTALEICLKSHRRNGCNVNQLKVMHELVAKSQELLK